MVHNCMVCSSRGPNVILSCGHRICRSCSVRWRDERFQHGDLFDCPLCRHVQCLCNYCELADDDIHSLFLQCLEDHPCGLLPCYFQGCFFVCNIEEMTQLHLANHNVVDGDRAFTLLVNYGLIPNSEEVMDPYYLAFIPDDDVDQQQVDVMNLGIEGFQPDIIVIE